VKECVLKGVKKGKTQQKAPKETVLRMFVRPSLPAGRVGTRALGRPAPAIALLAGKKPS